MSDTAAGVEQLELRNKAWLTQVVHLSAPTVLGMALSEQDC